VALLAQGVVGAVAVRPAVADDNQTLYASPHGDGDCSKSSPCALDDAIESAPDESTVIVEPGQYGSSTSGFTEPLETALGSTDVTIEGQPGKAAPVIYSLASFGFELQDDQLAHVVLHFRGAEAALLSNESFIDHVVIDSTAADACRVSSGTIVDSVCWAQATNGQAAVGLSEIVTSGSESLELVDDTVVSELGDGVKFDTSGSATESVQIDNSILHGHGTSTIPGEDFQEDAADTSLNLIDLEFCDFDSSSGGGDTSAKSIVETDSSEVRAEPVFAHAGTSLREAGTSPTVDAGANQLAQGRTDASGLPRELGAAVDIGAYEFPTRPTAKDPIVTKRHAHSITLHVEATTGGLAAVAYLTARSHGHSVSSHHLQVAGSKGDSTKDLTLVVRGLRRHRRYTLRAVVKTAGGKAESKHVTATTG
jgi:hypothetical protein